MSSIFPLMFREMVRPMRTMEHQMRLMDEMMRPQISPMLWNGWKGWRMAFYPESEDKVIADKDKFQVKVDVKHYEPGEVTVKMSDNNIVVIEAKHDEKPDENGFISRQFLRRFLIPEGHDVNNIASQLSSDGILTITAPKLLGAVKERVIPITPSGAEREKPKKIENENADKKE